MRLRVEVALLALLIVGSLAVVSACGASGSDPVKADGVVPGRIAVALPPLSDVAWVAFSEGATGTPAAFVYDEGTRRSAIGSFDPQTESWRVISTDATPTYVGPPAQLVTASDGRLWLGWSDLFGSIDPQTGHVSEASFPSAGESSSSDSVFDRRSAVQDASVDSSDRVWIAREDGAVFRVDPRSSRADRIALPPGINGGARVFASDDGVTIGEFNPTERGKLRAQRLVRVSGDGRMSVTTLPLGQMARAAGGRGEIYAAGVGSDVRGMPKTSSIVMSTEDAEGSAATPVVVPGMIDGDVLLAVSEDGLVWYGQDRGIRCYSRVTGGTTPYTLPRVRIFRPGGPEPGLPDDTSSVQSDSPLVDAVPMFTSAVLDSRGNLWFSCTMGSKAFAGVAYRPE